MPDLLITGGTGTLGQAIAAEMLAQPGDRILVYSRDEAKQCDMRRSIGDPHRRLRFLLGDVRDRDRLDLAMRGVQDVIHCAALKNLESTEYNPSETVRTNIMGSLHVAEAAIAAGVQRCLAVSTDKAVEPVSLYGASKAAMEHFWRAATAYGTTRTRFAVIRFGNFISSRGSVVPYWQQLAAEGKALPVTDMDAVRYWLDARDAACCCIEALALMRTGNTPATYIPADLERLTTRQLLERVAPQAETRIVGLRAGEKLIERMHGRNETTESVIGRLVVLNNA